MAETFNGWIRKARMMPIVEMLEDIKTTLIEKMKIKNDLMVNNVDLLCPKIRKRVEQLKWDSRMCVPKPAVNDKFQVKIGQEQFVVDLQSSTCSCRGWQLTGIPCIHGIASIHYMKHSVEDYVDDFFKKDRYLNAYCYALVPLNGPSMWQEINENPVLPPPFRKMPGRPKVTRKKAPEENQNANRNKLSRHGVSMRCKLCFELGHNKRGCLRKDELESLIRTHLHKLVDHM